MNDEGGRMKAEGGSGEPPFSLVTRQSSAVTRYACVALLLGAAHGTGAQDIKDGGPYVPTPQKVVEAMLDLAAVKPRDYVVDLGSGDGRIVLTAATRHKARGMGVDIDQELVDRANGSAQRLGVADRVQFLKQDVHAADLSQATVLTLYLLPAMMVSLRPKILKELRPGVRIVSHDFDFGDWKPDRTVEIETQEKYDLVGSWTSTVYLWIVPAPVQGTWRGALPDANGSRFQLELTQNFQRLEGKLTRNGREVALREGRVDGAQIRFVIPQDKGTGTEQFVATVKGDRMTGEIRGDKSAGGGTWTASRAP
jgi:Methyltransferase domain